MLSVGAALLVTVCCVAVCYIRKVSKVHAKREVENAEVQKQRTSQLQDTSRSIVNLQRRMDSFFDEMGLGAASGPRSVRARTQQKKAPTQARKTAERQQPPPPPQQQQAPKETPEQKKARIRKQSQAFTNANAARMFQAFQKLGHGGKGSLDIEDFKALCGGDNVSEVRQLFAMLDEDMSGTLEISEIGHALRHNKKAAELAQHYTGLHDLCHLARGRKKRGHAHHKHEIRSIEQFQAFAKLDEDGNGTLDENEFVSVCVGDDENADVGEVKKLFALLDEDHSGTVNCGELGHALKHNQEAAEIAKHYAALHDLVHMAHGRKHHKPHKHAHAKDKSVAKFAAFNKLDANGDGSLDLEEFQAVCGGDDHHTVAKLFALLDEDGGGTLDVAEICHALEVNKEAVELAKNFHSLHDLVDLSVARSHRHKKHHHKRHKKQRKVVVKERRTALVKELFGGAKVDGQEISLNHPKLRLLAEQDGTTDGAKAKELVALLQEEQTFAKHNRQRGRSKLTRRNTTRGGGGGGGDPANAFGDGGTPRKGRGRSVRHRPSTMLNANQSRIAASHRRTSQQRLVNMMQIAELRQSQAKSVARNRWKSTKSKVSLVAALRGGGMGRKKTKAARGAMSPRQRRARASGLEQRFDEDQKRDIDMFRAFQKLGHDGSGTIDISDFFALCGSSDDEVKTLFALLDEDKSGKINCAELGHALRHNKQAAKIAEHYTSLHDICHLAHGRKKRGHSHHKHASHSIDQFRAFAKLDEDGNGTLSEKEFTAVCVGDNPGDRIDVSEVKKLFALLDEDHSGTVNCGELGHALKHNQEAAKIAKHFAALHDLVHLAHGRKHHGSRHQRRHSVSHGQAAEEAKKVSRFAAFQKLDANGDGSLDFDEFRAVCGGDDDAKVRKLFDMLDLDLSGSLEVEELANALQRDPEAAELARSFHSLQDLVDLSSIRKHSHHSHHHHHHSSHRHKERKSVRLQNAKISLLAEVFGSDAAGGALSSIAATDPRLVALSQQSDATGEKARELIKVLQEEVEHAKIHASHHSHRAKLSRRNSSRHGSGRGRSRRRSKMGRKNTNARPISSVPGGVAAQQAASSSATRRKSSQRLIDMMGVQQLRGSSARNRWRASSRRVKMGNQLARFSGLSKPGMRSAPGPSFDHAD